jgi:sulfite dehydrogenase (quinone) subunit SoeA
LSAKPLHDPLQPPLPAAATEVKTTTCYMCACRCGIRVHLRDGQVRYIEGNPEHPLNKGILCAKGSAGIMKQYSPARLTTPLRRKAGTERGAGEFEPISWDEAFAILEGRLRAIRSTDPKKFALYTGRDQMQALTGLFARQFGTPNYAAHGGFCSVNMAAGMIYTVGSSFWEFGGPDLDRARLFLMIGTAEDHHSNPLKASLAKFKRNGGRFVAINPIRTGYAAIADEWVPIRPGTDGAFLLAVIRELIALGLYDRDFVARYTNGGQLVNQDEESDEFGLMMRNVEGDVVNPLRPHNFWWWDRHRQVPVADHADGADPALFGAYRMPDGTPVKPAFQLLQERVAGCTPQWAEEITGIPAATIRRLAREMGVTARDQTVELPIRWTDWWGREHRSVTGNPVAFHAMRGLAAHSNGFQTTRALAVLMSVLGTIDRPGGFRHKAPYPRAVPPNARPPRGPQAVRPDTPLDGSPLGWLESPADLFVDDAGEAVRLDKGFSWEYPLSAHGLMHNAITNAWRGDPYPIDTLLLFMANMAWNSSMNTGAVRRMLIDRVGGENSGEGGGEYKIPFIAVCDAFQSEMTAFADLILPDTTYLERHDVMSLLDRPISEFDGPCDSVRVPVVAPLGQCKPFQEVLIELASRLRLPAFTTADGGRKYRDYPDFVIRYETAPGSGIGFLSGWRGKNGDQSLRGEPNPDQWRQYAENNCVHQYRMPAAHRYMRNWNRGYLEWAQRVGLRRDVDPIQIHLYSEFLQRFRLAAQGRGGGRKPPERLRERVAAFFDPLPFWYPPLEQKATDAARYPLAAVTQRPMAMYHSWDSQNAWLRQIHAHNYLFVHPGTAAAAGIADDDWIWVESMWGKVRCMCRTSEAVEPGTVWTWNAIGKAKGAWALSPDANESERGFLLNHLISEELPASVAVLDRHTKDSSTSTGGARGGQSSPLVADPPGLGSEGARTEGAHALTSNSDPITGQAAWYDVRVRIYKADADEPKQSSPQFATAPPLPGMTSPVPRWRAWFAGKQPTEPSR